MDTSKKANTEEYYLKKNNAILFAEWLAKNHYLMVSYSDISSSWSDLRGAQDIEYLYKTFEKRFDFK